MDPAAASLLEDLGATPSKTDGKTLLDETLVVIMGEFGRTPGSLNFQHGRDHHKHCFPAMFAGAGVKGGHILGRAMLTASSASTRDGSTRCSRESKT
jgi:uncharacterized protein (DUF1501 family)